MLQFCRTILLILLLIAGAWSCAPEVDLPAETRRVEATLTQLIRAFETLDVDKHAPLWAADSSLVVFGVYEGATFLGWESLHDHFVVASRTIDSSKIDVNARSVQVHPSGRSAHFSMIVTQDVSAGGVARHIEGMRYTGVLEKRNGAWQIVQFHGSLPTVMPKP